MIKMYSGCARNANDVNRAVALAARTFRSNEDGDSAINVKSLLLSPEGSIAEQDVVVLAEAGEILGACFLFDRYFYRGRSKLKGTFLTSICIAESSRGKGCSALLMNCAINEVKRRGAGFAILIARRAVDHFYNKFNFWGLSQYSKIQLKLSEISVSDKEFSFSPVTESDLAVINTLYESTYSGLYGSCERSFEYWKHLMWRSANQRCNFLTYRTQGRVSGYVIFSGSELYEFATARNSSYVEFIHVLGENYSIKEMTLHCSIEHPISCELQGMDFSLTQRQCNYGGHMVRVINEAVLLKELEKDIQDSIGSIGIEGYKEVLGDALINFTNGKVEITLKNTPYSYKNTCLLMGADFLSMGLGRDSAYKPRSFNVSLFNQC